MNHVQFSILVVSLNPGQKLIKTVDSILEQGHMEQVIQQALHFHLNRFCSFSLLSLERYSRIHFLLDINVSTQMVIRIM